MPKLRVSETRKDNPDLAQLLPDWLDELEATGKEPNTRRLYRSGVESYLSFAGEAAKLDRDTVKAWMLHLRRQGRQATTRSAYLKALKLFAGWLVNEGELDGTPDEKHPVTPITAVASPKLDRKVIPSLDQNQLHALFKSCQGPEFLDRRDEAVARLMAETGMRVGECAGLRVDDVDPHRGLVTIVRGKGGKGRIVAYGPQTAAVLNRYLRMRRRHERAGETALWLGRSRQGVTTWALRQMLTRRAKAAGIVGFHAHLLRHTQSVRWLAAGGSEGGLMANNGWSRREMLDRYVESTRSELAAAESRSLGLGAV